MKTFRATTFFVLLTVFALLLTGCLGSGGSVEEKKLTEEQRQEMEAMVTDFAFALADPQATSEDLAAFLADEVEFLSTVSLMDAAFEVFVAVITEIMFDDESEDSFVDELVDFWNEYLQALEQDNSLDAHEWLIEMSEVENEQDWEEGEKEDVYTIIAIVAPLFEKYQSPDDQQNLVRELREQLIVFLSNPGTFMQDFSWEFDTAFYDVNSRWSEFDPYNLVWEEKGHNLAIKANEAVSLLREIDLSINLEAEENSFGWETLLVVDFLDQEDVEIGIELERENGKWVISGVSSRLIPNLELIFERVEQLFLEWLEEE